MRSYWRRLLSFALSGALALSLIGLTAPQSASAYTFMGFIWREGTPQQISYCITGGWGESRKNLIRTAVEKWNNQANINLYEDCGFAGAFWDIEITMTPQDSVAFGGCKEDHITFGNFYSYDGTYFNKKCNSKGGIVSLNPEWNDNPRLWWGQGSQSCFMHSGQSNSCLSDAKTIFMHEMGHALGVGHQQNSDYDGTQNNACTRGPAPNFYWYNSEADLAQSCPPSGRKVMSAFAGNEGFWWASVGGFRHSFASHDTNAIQALYGP